MLKHIFDIFINFVFFEKFENEILILIFFIKGQINIIFFAK